MAVERLPKDSDPRIKRVKKLEPGWYKRIFQNGTIRVYYVISHKFHDYYWIDKYGTITYKTITKNGLKTRTNQNYSGNWSKKLIKTTEDDIDVLTKKGFEI